MPLDPNNLKITQIYEMPKWALSPPNPNKMSKIPSVPRMGPV